MRTLTPAAVRTATIYARRAQRRADRWPLPGIAPRESHPDTIAALAMVREELSMASSEREIAASYSLATYSDAPWTVRS